MKEKRWNLKEVADPFEINYLADSLNISEILAKLLVLRNIKTFAQAKSFFRASLEDLHDPFLMNGMEEATHRVIEAVTNQEKILVYGDYDVDGTTSTAMLYMFLETLNANVGYFIPNRVKEGYGISTQGIDYAKDLEVKLLISVDCGITAVDEVEYAKKFGIDTIICDHHQPKEKIPNCYALLDPIKPNCNYPFKFLSGAGVTFKLIQGICERIGKHEEPMEFLDLVALSSAADIVPLIDENRVLVKEGLALINSAPRPGIKALLDSAKIIPGNLNSGQIVFGLAPRINAVGRLSEAKTAVELMITNDDDEATRLALVLEKENYERRKIDVDTLAEAIEKVVDSVDIVEDLAIVLHEENWHPGVIGIVASRLVEKYYKPTVMLTTIDGIAKGSARSIASFNIYEALKECEDLLIHFGGHEAAAGLAVELDKIDEFRKRFLKIVKEKIDRKDLIPEITIDSKIKLSEITAKFIRIAEQFSPFGPRNMRPVLWAEDVRAISSRTISGKHLVLTIKQEDCDKVFDCIAFNMSEFSPLINGGNVKFDTVFSIDQMFKDGKVFPQFRIKDIKIKENK
ncbi:MAG: single-stranded-DNA-specific exonuclease RecJ [Ignavibacteria bacterium CG22_combo_CG10-13_8_21_14_all_37_15]|nr:single-stranded-DNA-specific exonuclease RecJ [Ignavibacteria bacterium]PIP76179.1 MAG: single-stranded-DNA-specific exonuclease RecJ [Ignavibacteria bacterium CG22_combo_CG10-13_8_21_14_all_37_15]